LYPSSWREPTSWAITRLEKSKWPYNWFDACVALMIVMYIVLDSEYHINIENVWWSVQNVFFLPPIFSEKKTRGVISHVEGLRHQGLPYRNPFWLECATVADRIGSYSAVSKCMVGKSGNKPWVKKT
jgi:hypothetical protein